MEMPNFFNRSLPSSGTGQWGIIRKECAKEVL